MGNCGSACSRPEIQQTNIVVDPMKVVTNGANKTAQNRNRVPGISASHAMAQADMHKVNKHRDLIIRVARETQIEPAVVAALVSRDTNGRMTDGSGGQHLAKCIKDISDRFPHWSKEQQLKGGIAAYNIGVHNVHSFEHVDEYTTDGDYSNDVVARAQWYKSKGGF